MSKILTFQQLKNGFFRMKSFVDDFIITTSDAMEELNTDIDVLKKQVLSDSEYQELAKKLE